MEHSAWGIEKGARSQNSEIRRKPNNIEVLSTSVFFAASPFHHFAVSAHGP
jgi:hypothetical protein